MGLFLSQVKPGKGKSVAANPRTVPNEQASVAAKRPGQDLRALHNGESESPARTKLQKDARVEEAGCPIAARADSGGSNPLRISDGEADSLPVCPLNNQFSNTALKADDNRVSGEATSTNLPSSSQVSSSPDASSEVCRQGNPQWGEEYRPIGVVGVGESVVRNPSTGRPVLEKVFQRQTNTLRIHSPSLLNVMRGPAINNPDLPPTPVSLREPYEWVFYNHKRLLSLSRSITGQDAKLLLDFVQKEYSSTWDKVIEIETSTCRDIAFQDLWLLYTPGSTVFSKDDGGWRAYKISTVESCRISGQEDFRMNCYYLDFDGTGQSLTPQLEVLSIRPFSSERSIETLEIIPAGYIHDEDHLRSKLSERGTKYWKYRCGPFYQEYIGDAWPQASQNDPVKVVVDYATAGKHEKDSGPAPSRCRDSACLGCLGKNLELSPHPQGSPHDSVTCVYGEGDVTDGDFLWERLIFCPSKIWAFSLRHMTWKMVQPEGLCAVMRHEGALKKLWLKEDHKDVLKDVLNTHCGDKKQPSFDGISGKARSVKVLLHGQPGTGKTLTAELLSEEFCAPLYTVTLGDLGVEPDVFGKRLEKAFLRAASWKAILLLDHAEILIEQRLSRWAFSHNACVSIFLRHLDQYKGLVFVTSNPPLIDLEPAFQSRLDMALPFPDFTIEVQKIVWNWSIDSLVDLDSSAKMSLRHFINNELPRLDGGAYTKMNGRQITNCLKAALFYAHGSSNNSGNRLTSQHIERMLRLGKDFKDHLVQIKEADDPTVK